MAGGVDRDELDARRRMFIAQRDLNNAGLDADRIQDARQAIMDNRVEEIRQEQEHLLTLAPPPPAHNTRSSRKRPAEIPVQHFWSDVNYNLALTANRFELLAARERHVQAHSRYRALESDRDYVTNDVRGAQDAYDYFQGVAQMQRTSAELSHSVQGRLQRRVHLFEIVQGFLLELLEEPGAGVVPLFQEFGLHQRPGMLLGHLSNRNLPFNWRPFEATLQEHLADERLQIDLQRWASRLPGTLRGRARLALDVMANTLSNIGVVDPPPMPPRPERERER